MVNLNELLPYIFRCLINVWLMVGGYLLCTRCHHTLSLCFCLIARTQEVISAALEVAGPWGCQAQLTTMVNVRVHKKEGSEIQ